MEDKKNVRAPRVNEAKEISRSSFAVYFLRDLHARGVLNTGLLRELVESTPSIRSSADEIVKALEDVSGEGISQQIADEIERLALDMPARN